MERNAFDGGREKKMFWKISWHSSAKEKNLSKNFLALLGQGKKSFEKFLGIPRPMNFSKDFLLGRGVPRNFSKDFSLAEECQEIFQKIFFAPAIKRISLLLELAIDLPNYKKTIGVCSSWWPHSRELIARNSTTLKKRWKWRWKRRWKGAEKSKSCIWPLFELAKNRHNIL